MGSMRVSFMTTDLRPAIQYGAGTVEILAPRMQATLAYLCLKIDGRSGACWRRENPTRANLQLDVMRGPGRDLLSRFRPLLKGSGDPGAAVGSLPAAGRLGPYADRAGRIMWRDEDEPLELAADVWPLVAQARAGDLDALESLSRLRHASWLPATLGCTEPEALSKFLRSLGMLRLECWSAAADRRLSTVIADIRATEPELGPVYETPEFLSLMKKIVKLAT